MILVGRYLSPFVRRVGVSLKLLGVPYDLKEVSAVNDREAVEKHNPLGRVPALVLDDGEVLIDSAAILDHLDQLVGAERALVPAAGGERRRVLKLVALAQGVMEKALSYVVETKLRPEPLRHQPFVDRFGNQAVAGLAELERLAGAGWLHGSRISQADVSTVVALDFLRLVGPQLAPEGRFPKLEALRDRAYALPAFTDTKPQF